MGIFDKAKRTYNQQKTRTEAIKRSNGPSTVDVARIVTANTQPLMMSLGSRGEKLLTQNLGTDEQILARLKGHSGQGLIITPKRLYIVKWGFQASQTLGGKCIAYEYSNITGIQIKKHLLQGIVEILSPATQDSRKLSYWGGRGKSNDAIGSDNAVTFSSSNTALFQEAVNIGRNLIAKAHSGQSSPNNFSELDQLEKLAQLKAKGVITDQEFQAKKKQLLGL